MQDCIAECNNMGVSEEHFTRVWCIQCRQPECSRSNSGKSLFEIRVHSWKERLITHVAKLPEDHPRYPEITQKKFVRVGWEPPTKKPDVLPTTQGSKSEIEGQQEPSEASSKPPAHYVLGPPPDQSGKILGQNTTTERVVPPGGRIRLG